MCQGSIPSCWKGREAYHIINEPSFEVEDLWTVKEAGGNMYQRYIFLQGRVGPSVWISTHIVHERMETRIDQSHINIELTNLKITKNPKSLELGIMVKRVVLLFVVLFFLCCCSPFVQQGCCPFVHSFVVKVCYHRFCCSYFSLFLLSCYLLLSMRCFVIIFVHCNCTIQNCHPIGVVIMVNC